MAEAKEHENYQFREFLKHRTPLSSEEVDRLVFDISSRVWKEIDCTACGNCCREVTPTLSEEDVGRLAGHLGISHGEFVTKYLKEADATYDAPWLMRTQLCPFLGGNRCTVYEFRPTSCREYPYLHKPDLKARTLSMIGRLDQCPAVYEVWEQLKRALGFRYRDRSWRK
jgi:uncharacterized protein